MKLTPEQTITAITCVLPEEGILYKSDTYVFYKDEKGYEEMMEFSIQHHDESFEDFIYRTISLLILEEVKTTDEMQKKGGFVSEDFMAASGVQIDAAIHLVMIDFNKLQPIAVSCE